MPSAETNASTSSGGPSGGRGRGARDHRDGGDAREVAPDQLEGPEGGGAEGVSVRETKKLHFVETIEKFNVLRRNLTSL